MSKLFISTYYIRGIVLRISRFSLFNPPSHSLNENNYYHFINEGTEAKKKKKKKRVQSFAQDYIDGKEQSQVLN